MLGDPFAVNVAKAGTGAGSVGSSPAGIDCDPACSGAFDDGAGVTLSATPAAGSAFAGWSFKHTAKTVSLTITGLPARTKISASLVTGSAKLTRAKATASAGGTAHLKFKFSKKARKRLRSRKLKTVTLKVTATPVGDSASKASKRIKLKRVR